MANAALVAAIPNRLVLELNQTFNPFKEELFEDPLVVRNGYMDLPRKARLRHGIEARASRRGSPTSRATTGRRIRRFQKCDGVADGRRVGNQIRGQVQCRSASLNSEISMSAVRLLQVAMKLYW